MPGETPPVSGKKLGLGSLNMGSTALWLWDPSFVLQLFGLYDEKNNYFNIHYELWEKIKH